MLIESAQYLATKEKDPKLHTFGIMAHAYQPPRQFLLSINFSDKAHHADFSIVPEINDTITNQVYRPIFAETLSLPPGLVTSIYASLRSYLKKNKPDIFQNIQEVVKRTLYHEYQVLGDPLVHVILPFLPKQDQLMLFEAGKKAFYNDFGFNPKGIWLPETAVSMNVLESAIESGYEFIPLRDSQVTGIPNNVQLDAEHNVCFVQTSLEKEIALLLGNSSLSGFVSFVPWSTYSAERFMKGRMDIDQRNGNNTLMMMDMERFGHHQIGAEKFLTKVLSIQQDYGFIPLNMKHVIQDYRQGRPKTFLKVVENSSWSCPHQLGRWTGDCNCDEPSEKALMMKKYLFKNLQEMNLQVNRWLDREYSDWRQEFAHIFATLSDDIFTGVNFGPKLKNEMKIKDNEEIIKLFLAKIEIMIGMTSCGWFFGGDNSPEREIPFSMIQAVKSLYPEIL